MKITHAQVVAITGAGSGIGRALALRLASRGCHLSLCDIDPEGLAGTARMLHDHGATVTTAVLDVSHRQNVDEWAATTRSEHGAVHVVINNAGVAMAGTVEKTSLEDYEWLMGINFWGVVYGTKAFLPYLREVDRGHIANISSIFGLFAQPSQSAYNAARDQHCTKRPDQGQRRRSAGYRPGGRPRTVCRAAAHDT